MIEIKNHFYKINQGSKPEEPTIRIGGGYTVVEQAFGFGVPEEQLAIDTILTGLSGKGQVKTVETTTVFKGGTTG